MFRKYLFLICTVIIIMIPKIKLNEFLKNILKYIESNARNIKLKHPQKTFF